MALVSKTPIQTRAVRPRLALTRQTLRGVWPALIVPWTEDDRVDEPQFRREVAAYGGTGVHGVYTGGTTGEFYAQDDATFEVIAVIACEEGHRLGLPVQIGCTALSTRTVRQRIGRAIAAGADGIQIALPFWLELKDDEVLGFMGEAAEAAGDVPLILYHTVRAKKRLTPEFIGELAAMFPNLIGMKETLADVPTLRRLLAAAPGLAIFGGEHDLLEKMQIGGRGTYSSIAGLAPRLVVDLYELCAADQSDRAAPIAQQIARYVDEVLRPMLAEGLMDSAIDRVQRVVGGMDVGLRCQGPYRSATPQHVARLKQWCEQHAPQMLHSPSVAHPCPQPVGQE